MTAETGGDDVELKQWERAAIYLVMLGLVLMVVVCGVAG